MSRIFLCTPRFFVVLGLVAVWLAAGVASAQKPEELQEQPVPREDPCVLGPEYYRAARFLEARQALQECLELSGEAVEILLPLTVMAVREGRLSEGLEYGERAVIEAPEDPEARYWYGRALLRSDLVDEARLQWERGLALSVDHLGLLEGMARLSLAAGETAKAYNLLSRLQMLGVDDAWIHGLLAEIAAGKGMWEQALGHTRDALARGEPGAEDLLFAAELAVLSGHGDEAVEYGRQAVRMEPGARTLGSLGETFFATEQVDSAIVYLRRAVVEPGADPRHRFNLANALEVAGYPEEAGDHFRGFLAVQPDDAVGHFNYGVHLERMGRSGEALGEIYRAIDLDPEMLRAYVVMAQLLENQGAWDEALQVVAELKLRDVANQPELTLWEQRLREFRDAAEAAANEGKIHLLHFVAGNADILEMAQADLAAGDDFGAVVTRFSTGPAAARGGDIGWVRSEDLNPQMRAAVENLAPNEISPPLEAGGLYHMFKRIP